MHTRSILAFLLIVHTTAYSADSSATSLGKTSGKNANALIGSKSGINTRMSNPLLGQSKMTTMDGSKTFDSTVQCAANSKAIGITFLPVGGNDYRLIIKQDTDLDQSFDYTYDSNVLGRSVSGICNNGVVMCSVPGNWNSCNYYVWDTSDKKIFLRPVAISSSELGGCYCSNSSCGVNSLEPQMYETVGGGVSAAIMAKNPLFIHSKSQWSMTEMTYYLFGQNRTSCTGGVATQWDNYGQKNPTKYYESQTPPNTSILDVAVEQGSDPNSYYSMINHQSEVSYDYAGNKIGMPSVVSCNITNSIYFSNQRYVTDGGCETGMVCTGGVQDIGNNTYKCGITSNSISCGTNYSLPICGTFGVSWSIPDDARIFFSVAGGNSLATSADQSGEGSSASGNVVINSVSGIVNCSGSGDTVCQSHSTGVTSKEININASFYNDRSCGDGGPASSSAYIYIKRYEDAKLTHTDTCPTSNECSIQDEQVCNQNGQNCVFTIRNGIKQQITPPKNCLNISTSISSYLVCADGTSITRTSPDFGSETISGGGDMWFYIKRTYTCKAKDININTDQMQTTLGTVQKNESTSVMTYTDVGGVSRTAQLPTGDMCPTPMCTIKRPATDTVTFSDNTNRSQTVGGTGVYETVIKTCSAPDSISAKICPVDPALNEQMIEDCSCTGGMVGFQKAITTLEVVDKAAKDMICSQD